MTTRAMVPGRVTRTVTIRQPEGESIPLLGVIFFVALIGQVRLFCRSARAPRGFHPNHRMATDHPLAPTPLTFELPRSLVERIQSCRARLGLKSASAVVRRALESFDYAAFTAPRREQCQVSVRLSPDQKRVLFHHARRQRVSAGVLLRSALEALARRQTSRPAGRKPAGRKRVGRKRK